MHKYGENINRLKTEELQERQERTLKDEESTICLPWQFIFILW